MTFKTHAVSEQRLVSVSFGGGVNSSAMLVGMVRRGEQRRVSGTVPLETINGQPIEWLPIEGDDHE